MIGNDTDKIIEELFDSLLHRYLSDSLLHRYLFGTIHEGQQLYFDYASGMLYICIKN